MKLQSRSVVIFLLLLFLLTFYLYRQNIPLFFEGDDYLVLWYIQNPVSFLMKPFVGWHLPIAGRFGYGQAWYAAALYSVFGMNQVAFNIAGLIVRCIAICTIFWFVWKRTTRLFLAGLCALIFTLLSTGIEGTVFAFHHFHLLFASMVLVGLYFYLQLLDRVSARDFLLTVLFLFAGGYFYTIRLGGLIVLPVIALLYGVIVVRRPLISTVLGILVTGLVFGGIYATVPGISSVSGNLQSAVTQFVTRPGEVLVPQIQLFYLSLGHAVYPPPLRDLVNVWLLRHVLYGIGGIIGFMALIEVAAVLSPSRQRWFKSAALVLVRYIPLLIMCVVFLALIVTKLSGQRIYSSLDYLAIGMLGLGTFCMLWYVGSIAVLYTARIGGLLLTSLLLAIAFYVPNWLFETTFIAPTQGRYFTVSSVFLAIAVGTFFYLLFLYTHHYVKPMRWVTWLLLSGYLFSHLWYVQTYVSDQMRYRQEGQVRAAWNVVKNTADFSQFPMIVVMWSEGDIAEMKRFFHHGSSLMLAAEVPYTNELPYQADSYEQAAAYRCVMKSKGIDIPEERIFAYSFTKDRRVIPQLDQKDNYLNTWDQYCDDPTKKGKEPFLQ